MYLTAERLALANREIRKTFEQSSVAWRAIPHWDTGDPCATHVRSDSAASPAPLELKAISLPLTATLAQVSAPTPDGLLATVVAQTVKLVKQVDDFVIGAVEAKATPVPGAIAVTANPTTLMNNLIDARVAVENAGYLSPSCLLTNTTGYKALSQLNGADSIIATLLGAATVNSLNRAQKLEGGTPTDGKLILLGRRQLIAQGRAADASPGDEPVDIAVSVLPGLDVVGETSSGDIDLTVRVRLATRVKHAAGIVGVAKV